MPARAAGAAAAHEARRKRGAEIAAEKQAAKEARIDGSANRAIDGGDGNAELTARIEFSSDKYQAKTTQPTEVTDALVDGLMAKLIEQGESRTAPSDGRSAGSKLSRK